MGLSWFHKTGTWCSRRGAKGTVSASFKKKSTDGDQSVAAVVAPLTTATPIDQNQKSYMSLHDIIWRWNEPKSKIYISGFYNDAETEENPYIPKHLPLNSYYIDLTNYGYPGLRNVTVVTSDNYPSVLKTIDDILQSPTFIQKYLAMCAVLTRENISSLWTSGYKWWNNRIQSTVFWTYFKVEK